MGIGVQAKEYILMVMNSSEKGTGFLEEFKEFIAFLQKLWGMLAGISVFFPLSNIFFKVLPLKTYGEGGVYEHLSPSLITTITTLVTLFVVFSIFSNRSKFKEKQKRRGIQRHAWISFGIGILALVTYLIIYVVYFEYAWSVWGWGSGDPHKLFAEVPLLAAYSAFFAFITRAFMLLGMIEFFRPYVEDEVDIIVKCSAHSIIMTSELGNMCTLLCTISVLAISAENEPIPDANVMIEASEGIFTSTNTTAVIGHTDNEGRFSTTWQAQVQNVGIYGAIARISAQVSKQGFTNGISECFVQKRWHVGTIT
jgi:hypothetical protein